jgi:hypothetical protein
MFRGAGNHEISPLRGSRTAGDHAAWAIIFGAARRWFQTSDRIPVEDMASKIEAMVKPIFLRASKSVPLRPARE